MLNDFIYNKPTQYLIKHKTLQTKEKQKNTQEKRRCQDITDDILANENYFCRDVHKETTKCYDKKWPQNELSHLLSLLYFLIFVTK